MDLNQILAGGFVGVILQQFFGLLKDYFTFKREKTKIVFQNKLVRGEKLIALYSALYFHVRTLLAAFNDLQAAFADFNLDLDFDALDQTIDESQANIKRLESELMTEGTAAYLYYDLKNTHWNDAEFNNLFLISHRLQPKIDQFNAFNLDQHSSPAYIAIHASITEDIKKLIVSFTKYQDSVNSTMAQLKEQSK